MPGKCNRFSDDFDAFWDNFDWLGDDDERLNPELDVNLMPDEPVARKAWLERWLVRMSVAEVAGSLAQLCNPDVQARLSPAANRQLDELLLLACIPNHTETELEFFSKLNAIMNPRNRKQP